MRFFLFTLLFIVACISSAFGNLDYSRTHCVDYDEATGNFIFRSNMPVIDNEFAYDTIVSYFSERAQEECGVALPDDFYFVDVTLNDALDNTDWAYEKEFWSDYHNFDLGRIVLWPIALTTLVPPYVYPDVKAKQMANESVWKIDQLPRRVSYLHDMFVTPHDKPWVMLVHCTAGCDRTGEFIGAYRLSYQNADVYDMYAKNTYECGRSPNYYSTTSLEWYCLYVQEHQPRRDVGDCYNFAECEPLGDCVPVSEDTKEKKEK
jgi:hypothetical protein